MNEQFDGKFGEAWYGENPNGSHINVVITSRGSASHAAAVSALANPSPGHVPFLACLGAGNVVRPATIVVNKTTITNEKQGKIMWGAAQLGIGQGVLDAIKEGLLNADNTDDYALLVAAWVDESAEDETTVRLATRKAMLEAIRNALTPVFKEQVLEQFEKAEVATNNFYSGL